MEDSVLPNIDQCESTVPYFSFHKHSVKTSSAISTKPTTCVQQVITFMMK